MATDTFQTFSQLEREGCRPGILLPLPDWVGNKGYLFIHFRGGGGGGGGEEARKGKYTITSTQHSMVECSQGCGLQDSCRITHGLAQAV